MFYASAIIIINPWHFSTSIYICQGSYPKSTLKECLYCTMDLHNSSQVVSKWLKKITSQSCLKGSSNFATNINVKYPISCIVWSTVTCAHEGIGWTGRRIIEGLTNQAMVFFNDLSKTPLPSFWSSWVLSWAWQLLGMLLLFLLNIFVFLETFQSRGYQCLYVCSRFCSWLLLTNTKKLWITRIGKMSGGLLEDTLVYFFFGM